MEVIKYTKEYKQDFIDLNIAWIERYFEPEKADYDILNNIETLLQSGNMIYFAVENGRVLATCMAMSLGDNVWEICKLAAARQYTGKGAGSAVFKACMDYAIEHGAEKLKLVSNHVLKPALHIYEKFEFVEIPLNNEYRELKRVDIEYEYIVKNRKKTI